MGFFPTVIWTISDVPRLTVSVFASCLGEIHRFNASAKPIAAWTGRVHFIRGLRLIDSGDSRDSIETNTPVPVVTATIKSGSLANTGRPITTPFGLTLTHPALCRTSSIRKSSFTDSSSWETPENVYSAPGKLLTSFRNKGSFVSDLSTLIRCSSSVASFASSTTSSIFVFASSACVFTNLMSASNESAFCRAPVARFKALSDACCALSASSFAFPSERSALLAADTAASDLPSARLAVASALSAKVSASDAANAAELADCCVSTS